MAFSTRIPARAAILMALIANALAQVTYPNEAWTKTIDVAGRQRMLSQRMSKEFLFVAKGYQVPTFKTRLQGSINLFDSSLNDLINGNNVTSDPQIIASPTAGIVAQNAVVLGLWLPFKDLLEDNVNTVLSSEGWVDTDVLFRVMSQNVPVLANSNKVVGMLVDAAKAAGAAVAGLVVNTAGRQRMLIQRMAKEALLIGHGVSVQTNVGLLQSNVKLFGDSHNGIVRGATWAGVPELSKFCTLQAMRDVTYYWNEFQPFLNQIIGRETAAESQAVAGTDSMTDFIANKSDPLFGAMVAAVKLYVKDEGTCDPMETVTYQDFEYMLNNVGLQRMLGQKVSRYFVQLTSGNITTQMKQDSQVNLTVTLDTTSSNLRSLIEGLRTATGVGGIPAPPTQAIADKLLSGWTIWSELRTTISDAIYSGDFGIATLSKFSRLSRNVLTALNEATDLYEVAAQTYKPEVPAALINTAGRQRMFMQRMSKEAGLVCADIQPETNDDLRMGTRTTWLEVHEFLLMGNPDMIMVPRTENNCIIQQMAQAYTNFWYLDDYIEDMVVNNSRRGWMGVIGQIDHSHVAMHKAVLQYSKLFKDPAGVTCALNQPGAEEYRLAIMKIGELRAQSLVLAKEYFLKVAGAGSVSAETIDNSVVDFEGHWTAVSFGRSGLPPAINQNITDLMWSMFDGLSGYKRNLATAGEAQFERDQVVENATAMLAMAEEVMATYAEKAYDRVVALENEGLALEGDGADDFDMYIPVARLNAASRLTMLIQKMSLEAMLVGLGYGSSRREFQETQLEFETTVSNLRYGGEVPGVRRLQAAEPQNVLPYTIAQTPELLEALTEIETDYAVLKEMLQSIAGGAAAASNLVEMNQNSNALAAKAQAATPLFSQEDPYVPPEVVAEKDEILFAISIIGPLIIVCIPTTIGAYKAFASSGSHKGKQ